MLGLRFSSSWGIDHTEPTPGFGQSGKTAAQLFPVKPLLARTYVQRSNFRKLYTGWNHWQLNHVESCLQTCSDLEDKFTLLYISSARSSFSDQDSFTFSTSVEFMFATSIERISHTSRTINWNKIQGYFHTAIASTSESWRVTAMPSQSNMGPWILKNPAYVSWKVAESVQLEDVMNLRDTLSQKTIRCFPNL